MLRGHAGTVWSAAFSRDGAQIVTASDDGTARVWYSLFIPNGHDIEIRLMSLEYDAGSAARKMRDRGLPVGYAEALETGLWPSCDVLPATELTGRGAALAPDGLLWDIG